MEGAPSWLKWGWADQVCSPHWGTRNVLVAPEQKTHLFLPLPVKILLSEAQLPCSPRVVIYPHPGLEHNHRLSLEVTAGTVLIQPENHQNEQKSLEEPYQSCSREPTFLLIPHRQSHSRKDCFGGGEVEGGLSRLSHPFTILNHSSELQKPAIQIFSPSQQLGLVMLPMIFTST